MSQRMLEEQRTIAKMIGIYCHDKHGTHHALCESCAGLLEYAELRLSHCPFAPDKPVCGKCPVHCYRAEDRERIREVMRFAGPRMIMHDPVAAVRHLRALLRKPSPAVARVLARKAVRSEVENA